MKLQLKRLSLALVNASLISIAGCGGGSDPVANADSAAVTPATPTTPTTPLTPVTPVAPPVPTTTNVTTTVIDGAIKNATVCMDKNSNGQCDADEVQGKTDAAGSVTLAVPNADVGKFPLLALVGTDAVDADNGPVTVAFSMGAPADKTAVISPLTTMVQQTIASAGFTSTEAARAVQDATGIVTSPFDDFTTPAAKAAAAASASPDAAVVSRIIVVTTQQQAAALAGKGGTAAIDGTSISQADLDRAMQKKMLEQLPAVVTASIGTPTAPTTSPAPRPRPERWWGSGGKKSPSGLFSIQRCPFNSIASRIVKKARYQTQHSIANSQILAQLLGHANAVSVRQCANPLANVDLFNDRQFTGAHDRWRWQPGCHQVFDRNVAVVRRVGSAGDHGQHILAISLA